MSETGLIIFLPVWPRKVDVFGLQWERMYHNYFGLMHHAELCGKDAGVCSETCVPRQAEAAFADFWHKSVCLHEILLTHVRASLGACIL